MTERSTILQALRQQPQIDVLIIGGGVNGVGTFRDLALQGVRVLLVEKSDFCGGASAASSHMLHGGIRYLENGEFRLVREALHERNRLLQNAPHYAKPLPTAIPIFRWWSGLLNAPLKFLNLLNKPSERGGIVIKLGLMMYDAFTGRQQTMPFHRVIGREESLKKYPNLNPEIVCTAEYYDAWMPYPERLCLEMILDAEAASDNAFALNYVPVVGGSNGEVVIRDVIGGSEITVKPHVVINAAGPWIDFVNGAITKSTRMIGGTKGSHIILDHPQLLAATNGHEIFFENADGRIVLIFPYLGRVMVGTTDIRIDDPDQALCTDDEIDYMLTLVKRVFPSITVNRSQVVFTFCGVRPLPSSDNSRTGTISRDHSIQTLEATAERPYPVYALVGGKWTTFRAFSEQAADVALKTLAVRRTMTTEALPIGGGINYPRDEQGQTLWIERLQHKAELPLDQLRTLFERYGTRAETVAQFMSADNDAPLASLPSYTQREILFLTAYEKTESTADLVLRRSLIGMMGHASRPVVEEIAALVGQAKNWTPQQIADDISLTATILNQRHGLNI